MNVDYKAQTRFLLQPTEGGFARCGLLQPKFQGENQKLY